MEPKEEKICLRVCPSRSYEGYFYIEKMADSISARRFLNKLGKLVSLLGKPSVPNGCYFDSEEAADACIKDNYDIVEVK